MNGFKKQLQVLSYCLLTPLLLMCSNNVDKEMYKVERLSDPVKIDANWDKLPWNIIQPLKINNYMGDKPDHKPIVLAKLAYDQDAIYVIFQVKDQYVRAVADNYQGKVYEDSCVEFFFTPGGDIKKGYFNLETNCAGTALFHFQKIPRKDAVSIPHEIFNEIEMAHSLPGIIDPEITDQITWTLEYRIPFDILRDQYDITDPASGETWLANLYKCGDKTSHPHWLTWSVIDKPKPDFHVPEYFGILEFQ
ncbi:carbohydrate-binding family 9-like protein [Bacteroidota bacterium]